MDEINWLGITVAAASSFLLGGLWYSPILFGRKWAELTGLSMDDLSNINPAKTYGLSFVLAFIAAFVFAMFIGSDPEPAFAVGAGVSAGLCWVAASFGINYLFEQKPFGLFAINGGYHTLQFTLYGLVLALV